MSISSLFGGLFGQTDADDYELTIAIAGICQAIYMVEQYAHTGDVDEEIAEISFLTLTQRAPKTLLDVYENDVANLKQGFRVLLDQFSGAHDKMDTDIGRYLMAIINLEIKLDQSTSAKIALSDKLNELESELLTKDILDESVIELMANIYINIISPLGAKIKILGSPPYINETHIRNKIRASLLVGIRSATLLRQIGGTRFNLLLKRNKILEQAKHIYTSL